MALTDVSRTRPPHATPQTGVSDYTPTGGSDSHQDEPVHPVDDPLVHALWAFKPCTIGVKGEGRGPWMQVGSVEGYNWTHVDVPVPSLPRALDGLRIVHLSDLHLRVGWDRAYDHLHAALNRDPPDLLLVTGDYVEDKRNPAPAIPTLRRMLAGLTARLGCFGILGNHDLDHVTPCLSGSNLTLIDGARRVLPVGDASIDLIGLPGVEREALTDDVVRSLPRRREPNSLRVVLSHYPDHIRRTAFLRPDLFLAGHTHGGQVCLPGGFPLLRHDSLPRRLCRGIHRVGETWLIVSRGFGFSGLPLRLFCPAEVVEMRLRR
jgi:predicted MPP superfamily phosphohydrolase